MTTLEEKSPYIKQHDNKTICFADTLTQAKNALERKEIKDENKAKLDGGHLMLFGVETWGTKEMDELLDAMKADTNNFERLEIFSCVMTEAQQLLFGNLLDPENLSKVKQLDIDNTLLHPAGANGIFSKIAEIPSIEILNLQGSIAGRSDVIAAIADNLVDNANIYKSLWKIDLKINELNADCAEHAARIIGRLQQTGEEEEKCEVDLFYNNIGAQGVLYIAKALISSTCVVTHLDLSCNQLGNRGAKEIAKMLRINRTLRVLKIALNNIGAEGGIEIFKALAPKPSDKNQVQNTVLEVLDISANVMQEDMPAEVSEEVAAVIARRNELDEELKQFVDEDENTLDGKEADVKRIRDEVNALVYAYKEVLPLVEAISAVCHASHLFEFDFTGIELGNEGWDLLGLELSTTTMRSRQKRGVPMKIMFSLVDCMNEDNLKTLEKHIWGPREDDSSPYHTHKHIDWRRREDDANIA